MINDESEPDTNPSLSPIADLSPIDSPVPVHTFVSEHLLSVNHLRELSFRYMADGFLIVDLNGIIVDVNPAFCQSTGFSEEELIGSGPDHLYWPPEQKKHIRDAFSQTPLREFSDVELIFIRKNGERFPAIVNPFAIRDQNGTPIRFAATVRDITRHKKMESALREGEERYRELFENAADAIVILQGEKIIDFNERASILFGVASLEQMASHTLFDFFPPFQPNGQDSRKFSIDKLKAAKVGHPQFFAWHHVKLNGMPFEAEVSLSTFKYGESTFIQAIIRDITQRKALEQALTLSEQRYRNLFESAGDGILIMKGEKVLDCNERVLELYGISREHLMKLSDYDLSPPIQSNGQASPEFFAEKVAALQSENPQIFDWSGNKLDGTPIETEVILTTFMHEGMLCTQSMIRDITERKRLQATLKDSEMRFRMLFENAGDAIVIMNDHQIVDCNNRTQELYGRSRDAIYSIPTTEFFPQTQPSGRNSRDLFTEMVEASRSGNPQYFEWTALKPDGTTIDIEVTLTTFMLNNKPYTQSISRDITRRKQLETALKDSEMRFRMLFESAGDAIAIMKGEQIINCNQRTSEIYGVSRDDLLSLSSGKLFPQAQPNGKSAQELFDEMVTASRSGIPQVYEWHGCKPDGTAVITEITMTTFILDKQHYEQAISRDITERKRLEFSLLELNKNLENRVAERTESLQIANAELLKKNEQYRALAKKLTVAEEMERKRIVQLLHDDYQQLLVAAKLRVELLTNHLYGSDVNVASLEILQIVEQAIKAMRSLTMELSPPMHYGAGFVAAMQWLATWMETHHQLEVVVVGSLSTTPIPTEVSSLLFRAVRELLFNVVKHSGVKQARVNIVAFDQGLRISVTDDGDGFDVSEVLLKQHSYGLFSIQEQLISLNGLLYIDSTPQRGTVCTLTVPITYPGG